ncbi:MAG TPA: MFS transporter [Steroidobacteraceae bacterium]|nr:MFS transporter [Steroidobacteraceae bacterium]
MSGAGTAATAPKPGMREVLASPKMLAIMLLGAASGYPNQLTESVLQAWLKDVGASNTTIGLMTYVSMPYLLKPLWAPWVDRYPLPFLGRRRGWILVMQIALAAAIAMLAVQNPNLSLVPVAACAFAIVFFSATQDIAIDAYRTDVSTAEERGPAAGASNIGYRAFAWGASAIALILAGPMGWRAALLILAVGMAAFCIATWRAPEPQYAAPSPRTWRESIVAPLEELLSTPSALALIGVVMLFKLGDAFAMKLFTPFMMDSGFTKTEIGLLIKFLFMGSAIVGGIIAGVLMVRLGLVRSMLIFGALQAVSNLLYCALAAVGKSYPIMVAAVTIEHVAGAMGNTALIALIMALCDVRFSAFQYALLSAIALLPRYGLGYPAGWVADHGGWFVYYVVSFLIALPGLAMVWAMRSKIEAVDHARG